MTPAVHLVCNCDEALSEARTMQTEMAMKLGQLVTTDSPDAGQQTRCGGAPTKQDNAGKHRGLGCSGFYSINR